MDKVGKSNQTEDIPPKNEVKEQHQMKQVPSIDECMANEKEDGDVSDDDYDDDDDIASEAFSLHSEDFLKDMENDVFGIEEKQDAEQPNMVKELKELRQKTALERERAKLKHFEELQAKRLLKKTPKDEHLLSEEDTEILGSEKRILMAKICMHRDMFKTELKHTKFRIKKGATTHDLQQILDEMTTIVEINSMEAFTMDIILGSLNIVECVSSLTREFDITGLAEALKENPEFTKLIKLLFIKYQSFAQTPPEYRLIFLVLVNAVICTRMNKAKKGTTYPTTKI